MTGGIQATGQGESTDDVPVALGPGSDAMMRAIVQSSINPYVILDGTGHVVWVSDRVETLLGSPPQAFIGRHFLEMIDQSSQDAAIAEYAEFTSHAGDALPWVGPPMLLELVHADGSRITCEVSAATGAGFGIDGIVVQIRRWRGAVLLHAAVDALAAGEALPVVLRHLAAIAEHDMPGSAVFVAAGWDGTRFDVVEPAPITALEHGRLCDRIAATPAAEWLPDQDGDNGLEPLAAAHGFASCWSVPVTVRGDQGPSSTLVLLRPVPGRPGPNHTTVQRVASLIALAIESEHNRQAWRRSAVTDHLTDLPNRTGLEEWLDDRAAAAPDASVAVLFCDVDEFKKINDELGHAVGDRILRTVADRLRHSVRDQDLVARWGGDEFIVVCTDPAAAEGLARRLIQHIEQPFRIHDGTAHVGLSIGMTFGTFATPLDELLRTSDRALLEAKGQGRNRYVISR